VVNEDSAVRTGEPSDRHEQLEGHIAALEHGAADVLVLKKLALFCRENPANEPISPISPDFSAGQHLSPTPSFGSTRTLSGFKADLWAQGKAVERLFAALLLYLDPSRVCVHIFHCRPPSDKLFAFNDGHIECFRARVWFDCHVGNARASRASVRRPRSRRIFPTTQGAKQRACNGKHWLCHPTIDTIQPLMDLPCTGFASNDQLQRHADVPSRARVRSNHDACQHTNVPGHFVTVPL
jgi:hypothetical protein